jgi:hypothetical protein
MAQEMGTSGSQIASSRALHKRADRKRAAREARRARETASLRDAVWAAEHAARTADAERRHARAAVAAADAAIEAARARARAVLERAGAEKAAALPALRRVRAEAAAVAAARPALIKDAGKASWAFARAAGRADRLRARLRAAMGGQGRRLIRRALERASDAAARRRVAEEALLRYAVSPEEAEEFRLHVEAEFSGDPSAWVAGIVA